MNTKGILRIVVSVGLISFLIYKSDISAIFSVLSKSNPIWILAAAFLVFLNILFSALRMKYILSIYNIQVTIWYMTKLYILGNFYNNFLPTQMGGDVYKAYRLSKDILNESLDKKDIIAKSTFTVFMDRFSGLAILYLMGLVGISLSIDSNSFIIHPVLIAISIMLLSVLLYYLAIKLLSKKIDIVYKFKIANKLFIKNINISIKVFLIAFLVQIFAIFTQIFCFYAIGVKTDLIYSIFIIPIITLMGLIPSINGIGIQDIGFIFFFSVIGINREIAFAASILYHGVRLVTSLWGGIILFKESIKK